MKKHIIHLAAATAIATAASHAAVINWTVSTITNTDADVVNTGTTLFAASGADGGPTANVVDNVVVATVNGVQFTDAWTMDTPSHLDTLGTRANASGQYYEMVRFADRQGSGIARWTFNSLTVGNTYTFQVWFTDDVGTALNTGMVLSGSTFASSPVTPLISDPGIALLRNEMGPDSPATSPGQFATGTFVADNTTQILIARAYTNLNTTPTTAANLTVNAYQLRDMGVVPEPSTALLGGLGALALLRRRRN